MPISQNAQVFNLVKSLSRSEKRSFKLYVKRIQKDGKPLFVQLFELLDKMEAFDEAVLMKRMGKMQSGQFSNLKRNLYQHILTCLRLLDTTKKVDIQIREYVDYAVLLYERGLYLQALKILEKAKKKASTHHYDLLHLEILEFEKRIESRYITRTGPDYNVQLAQASNFRSDVINRTIKLSSLKQRLHAWFIQKGHVSNEAERTALNALFDDYLPDFHFDELTFFEKNYFYFAQVWYHHILLDFENVHYYARKWVMLFQSQPSMIAKDTILYLRALHYWITSSWYTSKENSLCEALAILQATIDQFKDTWSINAAVLAFLYQSYGRLNYVFWSGKIAMGVQYADEILAQSEFYKRYIDPHKIMILRYKLAWLYFCAKQPNQALDHLIFILNYESVHLREDLQAYSQLLFLLIHYDLKNYDLVDYRLTNSERFLKKATRTDALQQLIIQLLRRLISNKQQDEQQILKTAYHRCLQLQKSPYLRRSFTYLDFPVWLNSKIIKSAK